MSDYYQRLYDIDQRRSAALYEPRKKGQPPLRVVVRHLEQPKKGARDDSR